ncbi:MAG: hypothetical protein QM734_02875 [Cyclobacteriaceae bacterium]
MSSDDLIQNQIEGKQEITGPDADAYKIVFKSLKKEPNYNLSNDFALKVSSLAESKKTFNWERFILISGIFGFLGALIFSLAWVKPSFSFGVFTFFSGYRGLIIFAIIFVLVLNWVDKKLIRPTTTI